MVNYQHRIYFTVIQTVGLPVGSRFDGKDDSVEKLIRKLDEILPERIQRW